MILSSKVATKFANGGKLEKLGVFVEEYTKAVAAFVDLFWNEPVVPSFTTKEQTAKVQAKLSARALQAAGKQAAGIVRGVQAKQKKRLYIVKKLLAEGNNEKAKKLQEIYDKTKVSKPKLGKLLCCLDSRLVKISLDKKNSFDGWLTLAFGDNTKLFLPFKRHKHFNKLLAEGKLRPSIQINKEQIIFAFEIPGKEAIGTAVLGIDIGQTSALSCSNGQQLDYCKHGHTYKSICEKLARKKKGSKNFKQAVKHRTNFLHFLVNKIDLKGVRCVNRENIKNLRKGKNLGKSLGHWNYAELFDVLDLRLEKLGVQVNKLNPAFTSQRCFSCGWVQKENRKEKSFKCCRCGYAADADLNAASNLSLALVPLGADAWLKQDKFYWIVSGEEPIVPHYPKSLISHSS